MVWINKSLVLVFYLGDTKTVWFDKPLVLVIYLGDIRTVWFDKPLVLVIYLGDTRTVWLAKEEQCGWMNHSNYMPKHISIYTSTYSIP